MTREINQDTEWKGEVMNLLMFCPPPIKGLTPDKNLAYSKHSKSLLNDYQSCQWSLVNMSLQGVCW